MSKEKENPIALMVENNKNAHYGYLRERRIWFDFK